MSEMQETIDAIIVAGKGILAADESTGTIEKRLKSIGVNSTEEARRDYRDMLFTAPNLSEHISGVILFEETLTQLGREGRRLSEVLHEQGIIAGIKVDKGLVALAGSKGEKVTSGLDGLRERLLEYKAQGARFAKWRAVYAIGEKTPSRQAIVANAEGLARYAALCQEVGIVPIVEPEVLMDGSHDIERSFKVHEQVLQAVFTHLCLHNVVLEQIILKPSMVISGTENPQRAGVEEVAEKTLTCLRRHVPAAVPTINFLSGGQSDQEATAHLQAMNAMSVSKPWVLSFSYGRALQSSALSAWSGDNANREQAQQALMQRAKLNGAASIGQYNAAMETVTVGA